MKSVMRYSFDTQSPRPAAHPVPPRQPAPLTCAYAQTIRNPDRALPEPVKTLIVDHHSSAFRAWRTHQGLSMRAIQHRTGMFIATLLALDSGDVALCEWTVERLAKALNLDASQLLKAESLARLNRGEAMSVGHALLGRPASR